MSLVDVSVFKNEPERGADLGVSGKRTVMNQNGSILVRNLRSVLRKDFFLVVIVCQYGMVVVVVF
jgi:hypothetical protein